MKLPPTRLLSESRRMPRTRLLTLASIVCFAPGVLLAQSAPDASAPATSSVADEETVNLSPFVVNTEEERGYQATNTLAGTRLRSSLKDVASPISVFTSDLLRDIAASNFQEAMLYSVNVENENEFAPDDTEGESVSSTTQNRVRGLAASTQTRGFFKTNFRSDTYNTERLTVASGPNSILFGIGSPAGVLDATPVSANLKKVSGGASFRVDNNDSYRVTADVNVPIVKNKLALHAAELKQKNRTFREPEFDDERRHYLAATFQPVEGTTIRANYEHMKNSRVRARETLMDDKITDWIAMGKPLYDFSTNRWTFDNGATWVERPDLDTDWINEGGIGYRNRVFIADGNLGGSETQGLSWENTGLSYDRNRIPSEKSFSDDSLVPTDINYYGLGDRTELKGEVYTVSFEQKIAKDLYAEVAYNRETNTRVQHDPLRGGLSAIQADVNYYLPYPVGQTTGELVRNPNVGRTYIDSEYLGYIQNLDFETTRAMLSYSFDFAEHGLKYLGRYNFGAMWQRETTDNFKIKRRLVNQGDAWIGDDDDFGINNVKTRYYLDIPGLGGDSAGVQYPGNFQMPPWDALVGGFGGDGTPQKTQNEVTGKLFVVQGFFLDNDLALTFGYRKDQQKAYKATFTETDPVTREHVTAGVDYDPDPIIQEGITRTYGAVYHTPLKWLSLLYNRSDAFNPQGDYRDWFNNPLPPGSGEGEDYGVQIDLLENKLSARITRFSNTSIDNVELDWYYEAPKWSVAGNMDADWGNITGYARRLGNTGDINVVEVNDTVRATRDFEAEGYEAELFYKPTKQLDLRFTLSQTKATNLRVVPLLQEYINSRIAVWEKYYGYPAWQFSEAELPAWDPNWQTNPDSIGYQLLNALSRVEEFKASEGTATTRGRKWRSNFIATYRFDGRLSGFTLGGAARWRSADTIGYYGKDNALLPGGPQVPDVTRPIKGDDILLFDSWIEYNRDFTVGGAKLNWSIQLNVRNVFNDDKITPVDAYVDGTITAYTRNEPRTFILTNSIRF